MKSKIAEEYIDENIYDAAECVDNDGCGYIGPVPEEVYPIIAEFVKFAKVDTCKFEMVGIENFVTSEKD